MLQQNEAAFFGAQFRLCTFLIGVKRKMQKSILVILLAMILCLTACGSNTTTESILQTTVAETPLTEANNKDVIELDEPLVVADNEYFKLEILRFKREHEGYHIIGVGSWSQGDGAVHYVDVRFYNKSEFPYQFGGDFYIADESVWYCPFMGKNGNFAPAPGKNALMEIGIYRWDGSKELPIELDELYQLNGTIFIFGNDISRTEFSFSIPNAMA